ncbi:MAG TPA: transcription-repair coupling factor, partial [Elusimicrobiota bacterium]|nr:transcription-repair coupling factor [Elusimicrobiota bacterium]
KLGGPQPAENAPATLLTYLREGGALFESVLPPEAVFDWTGPRYRHADLGPADKQEPFQSPPPLGAPGTPARMNLLADTVRDWMKDGWRLYVFCHNQGEQERLEEILLEQDRRFAAFLDEERISFPLGPLTRGFLDPANKRAVLANGELFGRTRRRLRLPKFGGGKTLSGIVELSPGDYVVHERFGIGRYKNMERVEAGGVEADYLRLEYKGGDRVFVPLFEFRQVQKFIGTDGKKPRLSSLDTSSWERTKQEVQASVAQMAAELLERAARRAAAAGISFPPDSHMEKEFGASFLYELTPDQAKAIEEMKSDMVRPRPMDRLVCGDVGYGKTEVALRAAFKAVVNNRQVAVLVPTTILAEQHGRNFRERFADYPVAIAVLSRFATAAEQKRVIADVRRGVIDIVIGTHRLLSPDIVFKNLGLVVIDEEHRFGVKQKERLMAFRDVVDVLALSATPIPRTLAASMGGVKSLSVIETPPEGRLPIATHVGAFDEKIVAAAVEHELRRGGQVFYVHNRVETIEERRRWLEKSLADHGLTPKIALAHGQMSGAQLEKTMWDFLHKKYGLLISTSIIESGLDIPSVNTLIVEEAEDFGLAQLYQLRGRVGRERQKAYCYLFYSPGSALTEEARKRLTALKEFASLGSGFRLALRDLEIRGAGNLLGAQQHGFVNAVGIDLYGQLLTEEIRRQKGGTPDKPALPEPAIELPVSAYLPEDYLPSETERIAFYRRILDAAASQLHALREELEDRCGRLPEPAERLFEVAALRLTAREKRVTKISQTKKGLEFRFHNSVTFAPALLDDLPRKHGETFSFLPGPPFGMRVAAPAENVTEWARNFLSTLG